MGLLLSKYGIGPTEEWVCAVLEAVQPTMPTEVRSTFHPQFCNPCGTSPGNLQVGCPICMGQRAGSIV